MSAEIQTLLILLSLLQVKHLLGDYFFQTPRMLINRSVYVHMGRAQHAGLHAVMSVLCFLAVGAPLIFVIVLCLLEGALHYHIDWIKGRYSEQAADTPTDASYWRAFGIDQLMHQFTYVVMIWVWVAFTF